MQTKIIEDEGIAETVRLVTAKVKDQEALRKARERADKLREEMRNRYGVRDIVMDLIRETRDGE